MWLGTVFCLATLLFHSSVSAFVPTNPSTKLVSKKRPWLFAQSIFDLPNSRSSNDKSDNMASENIKKNNNYDDDAAERPGMATLRIHGPDSQGIVAAFSQLLYGHGCGIFESEQSTDREFNLFFQRIKFDYGMMHTDRVTLEKGVNEVCDRFKMNYQLNWGDSKKKICIMVSKYDHCLWELLLRHRAGELDCEISLIISNHPDLKPVADAFNVPFEVFAINKANKAEQEAKEIELMKNEYKIDLVILARYMQIISDNFCNTFNHKVINIHHSFLPAFVGGKPYHRAHERGVKLIGATAHYATADLDEGPILEQDICRISHRDDVSDLLRKGRILERNVLVHAVKAHLEDRIIVYNNKCVVFGD
ncbi:Formyl transferase [Fragilaria crotonensis]|nr:Formyl transferase [Fragilaria crotonensis]